MKNILFLALAAAVLSVSAKAQSTADSIQAKYKLIPMPEALTIEKTFPVIGTYQLNSGAQAGTVTISLDSSNRGIVWVDGLPEGRIKAYLKKAPATYRIVAQTSSIGKSIPEGTLVFNQDNNTLNISLGAPFNDTDPTAIFAMGAVNNTETVANEAPSKVKVKTKNAVTKTKTRVMFYTATKTSMQSGNSVSSTSSVN